MTRYAALFERVQAEGRGAFIPFAVIGDPNPEASFQLIMAMVEGGADALELAIPFSDPIADGPTIQAAAQRALAAGTTPDDCWTVLARVRAVAPQIPIGLLTYSNLAAGTGIDAFYRRAASAGVDSILMADVPTLEIATYAEAAQHAGIDPVMIAPPNASATQLDMIAATSQGYTYVVTRFGVTGARDAIELEHGDLLAELKARNAPPAVMGFGIASPEAVKQAIQAGAAGAISGSAIVARIARWNGEETVTAVRDFVAQMRQATALS